MLFDFTQFFKPYTHSLNEEVKEIEKKRGSCVVCSRRVSNGYCSNHQMAYDNIIRAYEKWKKVTEVSWKEYLEAITDNLNTGSWAAEMSKYLLSNIDKRIIMETRKG